MEAVLTHESYIILRVITGMALLVYLGAALLHWLKVLYPEERIEKYYRFLRNCSIVICVSQALYLLVDLFNNVQKLEAQGVLVTAWKYVLLNGYPLIVPIVIFALILHHLYVCPQETRQQLLEKVSGIEIILFAAVPAVLLIIQSLYWPNLVDAVYLADKGKEILMNMQGMFFAREMSVYVCLDAFIGFAITGVYWSKPWYEKKSEKEE